MSKIILGAGLFGMTTYTFFLIGSIRNHIKRFESSDQSIDTANYGIKEPFQYDKTVNFEELLMGIWYLRYKLISQAKGPILENAIGTGRNYSFYHQKSLKNFVGFDISPEMIEQAKNKWLKLFPQKNSSLTASFITNKKQLKEENGKQFETIVQTFALCSAENPIEMLNDLSDLVRPEGKILLLEHGKSKYNWLNRVLNAYASNHNKKFGCLFNRDIMKILNESKLEIIEMKRYHFGTTYYIIAKKKKDI